MSDSVIELINISKSFADQPVLFDINLTIRNGEFITLLGPSGCGKTTLLRLISGFETPSSGTIKLNGRDITMLSPEARHVNTVFQSYALFPHMSVYENVAFGLRCVGESKTTIDSRVREMLSIVKLEKFMHRMPRDLSGGQQQRVAIARALVNHPAVLLLDEPLSSLDYRLRIELQLELKQLQRKLGITFIFVTHDQQEALSMSDRVVVLADGQIQQVGTPRNVYESPVSLSVAKFIGEVNVFDTTITHINDKVITVPMAHKSMRLTVSDDKSFELDQKVHILIRPEDLHVWDRTEVTDTSEMLPGVVEEVIYKGSTVDLMVRLQSGKLIAATEFFDENDADLAYTIGEPVWLEVRTGWEVVLPHEDI